MIRPSHRHVAAVRAGLLVALALGAGCRNRQSNVIPNRVLDRPLDVVLACVRDNDGTITPVSLDQCSDAVADSVCGDLRLIGFVANSERDDIAMFSRCAGAVIDMDVAAPGPQLISAGEVPSSMTVTTGVQAGCFAISANLGSCDLSVLDVSGLASYAFEEPPEDEPGAYVSNVVPRRADGTPLGARPGQVIAVPPDLSNAEAPESACDPAYPGSVYVTFPSCQLVAEVDLRTQRVLQSRQFVRDDKGVISVIDSGPDPLCPVDCAEQFLDPAFADALKSAPTGDPDGMYPLAMALIQPPADPSGCVDGADLEIKDASLYVGGLGADMLYELRYDGTRWTDDPLEFEVEDAQGISAIRPTPAMILTTGDVGDLFYQFLYIIAGDGSTRVVRRNTDPGRDELGNECDTQVDPTAVINTACHPAEFPGESPPDRRPFARGPGIRASTGAIITDWTFQKWYRQSEVEGAGGNFERCAAGVGADDPGAGSDSRVVSTPFTGAGVVGVGATSFGRLVFAVFDQFSDRTGIADQYDHLGLLDARIPPHTLWPQIDPTLPEIEVEGLPRVEDKEPQRLVPGEVTGATVTRTLAPTLRRIDAAYERLIPCTGAEDCDSGTCDIPEGEDSGYCAVVGPSLRPPVTEKEQDLLAIDESSEDDATVSGLYKTLVPRVVVRDYLAWIGAEWNIVWEGDIPGTNSPNGQLVCEQPGWQGGTCLSSESGDTRLLDQTAQFCDAGVLAGDKLLLNGCGDDSDCGVGQYCLVDPEAPANASGLCVSQEAYEQGREDLLQICRPFLRDDCGAARREFLITRAFQDELWLQALDKKPTSYVMMKTGDETSDADAEALCRGDRVPGRAPAGCVEPDQDPMCGAPDHPECCLPCAKQDEDAQCGEPGHPRCCAGDYVFTSEPGFVECEERLRCSPAQPDNGCGSHSDCAVLDPDFPLCIDGLCQGVCGPGEDCVLTPLPGPTCFRELAEYQVRVRNSFVVRGQGSYDFLPERVKADPETGECYEDPTVSNLLTSRIRLGSDEDDTRFNDLWPMDTCPADAPRPDAGSPNPCIIDTTRPATPSPDTTAALYHHFLYGAEAPQPVPAIRYSNPMMSVVLDLTSLKDLVAAIPGTEGAVWPDTSAGFRRSRIPAGYREAFSTKYGYSPFDVGVVTSSVSLVGPTRIVNAPELSTVFIVDSSGGGGGRGTRGQVVRVTLASGQANPDVRFLVR